MVTLYPLSRRAQAMVRPMTPLPIMRMWAELGEGGKRGVSSGERSFQSIRGGISGALGHGLYDGRGYFILD
jgi:hypothetical protein